MTKKHFIAIAVMLKEELDSAVAHRRLTEADAIARVARRLAVELSGVNPAFRFNTFYAAIGLTSDGFRPVEFAR